MSCQFRDSQQVIAVERHARDTSDTKLVMESCNECALNRMHSDLTTRGYLVSFR